VSISIERKEFLTSPRDEVSQPAGISVEYYTRLERGNAAGASDSVLDGIARALQLDEAERTHPSEHIDIARQQTRSTKD
jgi:transcriptional regulator with XRE-family HTH domain